MTVGYFNSIGTCNLCSKKLPYFRDSNRLPGVFITKESITNTNNSTNIWGKIRNRFWACPSGPGKVFWWKNRRWKISWHCPFKLGKNEIRLLNFELMMLNYMCVCLRIQTIYIYTVYIYICICNTYVYTSRYKYFSDSYRNLVVT